MMTQTQIAAYFRDKYGVRLDQPRISRILDGRELISWPFAHALSLEFPGKNQHGWKYAEPKEIERAFNQLEKETVA